MDYLHRCIGSRTVPLACVIHPEAEVPAAAPPLAQMVPHSETTGSVAQELINRASNNHARFRDNNAVVYYKLEQQDLHNMWC